MQYAFALLYKGKLLSYEAQDYSNRDFCVNPGYRLSDRIDKLWLVRDKVTADIAAVTSPPWFNADYNNPENPYAGLVQVVRVIVEVEMNFEDTPPTARVTVEPFPEMI